MAIDKNDVAADAELRIGERDCFFGRGRFGHERGAGQWTAAVEFNNRSVDACGQAEVVGVYNHSLHLPSVSSGPRRSAISACRLIAGMMGGAGFSPMRADSSVG